MGRPGSFSFSNWRKYYTHTLTQIVAAYNLKVRHRCSACSWRLSVLLRLSEWNPHCSVEMFIAAMYARWPLLLLCFCVLFLCTIKSHCIRIPTYHVSWMPVNAVGIPAMTVRIGCQSARLSTGCISNAIYEQNNIRSFSKINVKCKEILDSLYQIDKYCQQKHYTPSRTFVFQHCSVAFAATVNGVAAMVSPSQQTLLTSS